MVSTTTPRAAFWVLLHVLLMTTTSAILRRPKNAVTDHVPPQSWLNTAELISFWGYPAETHWIRTEDGYILTVHRIPGPKLRSRSSESRSSGPAGTRSARAPVLLMHGFGSTSECMVLREHKTLAFMMANADFDVWIGNFRGTYYGRRHVSMTPADTQFWDFSWHENGVYDLAAMLDYIVRETGQSSVLFAGHSMGNTALLALLSEKPHYNAKVRATFMITPAVYFRHVRGGFKTLKQQRWAYGVVSPLRLENIMMRQPVPELCMATNGVTLSSRCFSFIANAQGPFHSIKNNTYLPVLLRHWPGGTSVGQAMHFGQLIIRGNGFYKYDYGPAKNLKKYGATSPPAYNLTNARSPTFIFYTKNDYQAHYKDVRQLAADLPALAGLYETEAEIFNHLDAIYEEDAADLIYTRLMEQMTKYK